MTKEEVIKNAYGRYYNPHIDENGWFDMKYYDDVFCSIAINGELWDLKESKLRPKTLRGIENNNGWISVNENLPKEKGYYIMYNGENMVLIELNDTTDMITLRDHFLKDGFTHYQPIIKPKPPLF